MFNYKSCSPTQALADSSSPRPLGRLGTTLLVPSKRSRTAEIAISTDRTRIAANTSDPLTKFVQ